MKLPSTSENRRDRGFLRLLTFVDPAAPAGLQFDGQLLSPGSEFDPAALPRPAVLLECAGSTRISPERSRYAFAHLWVLWRFDFEILEWKEIVRATSRDSSYTLDFAPIAYRHLYVAPEPPEERAAAVSERLREILSAELAQVARDARCHVLAALDLYLSSEIVRASKPLHLVKPMGTAYSRIGGALASESHRARAVQ